MIRLVQNSFFGGQLDFEMMGRQDYQRYARGATKLCNFNILKRGGLDKRRGFDRLFELTTLPGVTASTRFRAIPFAYKKTQGFVLLMSGPKCLVISTNPVNQFKWYEVTDLDGIYSSAEIEEIDYQQCGDVIFLAHQNHQPARIVHDIGSDGEHGFHYETLDLNQQKNGIPTFTASRVTRMPVQDEDHNAPIFTEKYKVTAIFDGVETYPSSEYGPTPASPWGAQYWSGTGYPMPWTESQKIALTISIPSRFDQQGIRVWPEEVRIYKKAYNYFGLIGSKKFTPTTSMRNASGTLPTTTFGNSDGTSLAKGFDNTANTDVPVHGVGWVGYLVPQNGYMACNLSASAGDYSVFNLGDCYYTVIDSDNIEFHYKACTATKLEICKNQDTKVVLKEVVLPSSYGDKVMTCTRNDGESASDFSTRWHSEYVDFCQSIKDGSTVSVVIGNSAISNCRIYPVGGDFVFSNIRTYYNTGASSGIIFEDNYITPDTSITPPERDEDIFDGMGNYPASVSLSQQRLIWASTKNDPARVWLSQVGDFYTYSNHEIVTADDPIDFTLPVTRFAKINHICEMRKLLMFNSACEWLVDSASSVQGLTFETIQAYPQSYSGSSERLKPIICNNSLIFCERTGQAVRRFAYDISNDGFAGRDVSILSASIFENNSITDWTYQQFPYSTLWCVMADGNLSSFEFMEEQDIMAWMTHRLGGDGKAICVATSYGVAPAMDEVADTDAYAYATHEEVFAVVRRQGRLWVERMRVRSRPPVSPDVPAVDSIYHSLCMDGVRVLNSENGYQPTEETGAVWIPADTTTGATITREDALAKIGEGVDVYEGFPFDAEYISVFPNINNGQIGNGQFDIKHVQGCGLRLMNSFGGAVKPLGADSYEPIQYFYNDPQNDHRPVFADGNLSLHNHDTNIMPLVGVNNRDGRVSIKQSDPYPFSVLSYEIDFEPESGGFRG